MRYYEHRYCLTEKVVHLAFPSEEVEGVVAFRRPAWEEEVVGVEELDR